jgi:CheY-like chemotaxis protein
VRGIYQDAVPRVNFGTQRQVLHSPAVAEPAEFRQIRRRGPREPTRRSSGTNCDSGMPTVLLVDDESSMRSALRKLFERAGLTVLEADSGRVALEAIASDPGISAVVSDFLMPEINGLDFYDALVARSPHLRERVVFLTGAARDPQVHQSLEQRGVPLVSKLDDLHIVLDAVKLALLRRQ